MAFLRFLLVCVLIFFAVVAIRKIPKNPAASSAAAPAPSQTQPITAPPKAANTPRPVAKKQVAAEPPSGEPSSLEAPPKTEERPSWRLTPTDPVSGLPDTLTFTIQECHHDGNRVQCSGIAKCSAEIGQHISLQDSQASDDQGRSFEIIPVNGDFKFDTGWSLNLVPGAPLRFKLTIHDPYPSSKTMNLNLSINYGPNPYFNFNQDRRFIYRDIPVQ